MLPFTAAIRKQYGNLDISYMLAIWEAKDWLENLENKRETLRRKRELERSLSKED